METPTPSPEFLAEDNSALLLRTSIAFLVLETLFMIIFYISRYLSKERPNLWMVILMTLTYISCAFKIALSFLMVSIAGAGRHLEALSAHTLVNSGKVGVAMTLICPLTTSLSKLGILCYFDRIFSGLCNIYRIVIRLTFGLVLATTVTQVLLGFLNCRPFSSNWNFTTPHSCAIAAVPFYRFIDTPNIITTFVILAIPIPGLIRLNHTRPMKLGLAVVFAVCVPAIVAAAMRFKAFFDINEFTDMSYEIVRLLSWTIAESGLYLVAGVLLTLRPLLKALFKGTKIEAVVVGKSSSDAGRMKCSRGWFKAENPVFIMEKNRRSLSDASGGTFVYSRTEVAKSGAADSRW